MSGAPCSVRRAEARDAEALADLAGQLGYAGAAPDVARRLAALRERADHEVLVAEVGGRVAGWAHVNAHPTLVGEEDTVVAGLVVDAAHRGQGVGRALMAAAEDWARARGHAQVVLRSRMERAGAAHEFYKSLGYEITKTQAHFRRRL